jgi:hypothetical protein
MSTTAAGEAGLFARVTASVCPGGDGGGAPLTVAQCLASVATPVAISVGGPVDAMVVRSIDVVRFVNPGRLAYVPLLMRTPQPSCQLPLDDCVDTCCADEPVWAYGYLPGIVAAPADLVRALGPDSPAERLLDVAMVAAALRDQGVTVLRVPMPGEAGPSETVPIPPLAMTVGEPTRQDEHEMEPSPPTTGHRANVTSTMPAVADVHRWQHGMTEGGGGRLCTR